MPWLTDRTATHRANGSTRETVQEYNPTVSTESMPARTSSSIRAQANSTQTNTQPELTTTNTQNSHLCAKISFRIRFHSPHPQNPAA